MPTCLSFHLPSSYLSATFQPLPHALSSALLTLHLRCILNFSSANDSSCSI